MAAWGPFEHFSLLVVLAYQIKPSITAKPCFFRLEEQKHFPSLVPPQCQSLLKSKQSTCPRFQGPPVPHLHQHSPRGHICSPHLPTAALGSSMQVSSRGTFSFLVLCGISREHMRVLQRFTRNSIIQRDLPLLAELMAFPHVTREMHTVLLSSPHSVRFEALRKSRFSSLSHSSSRLESLTSLQQQLLHTMLD